jgi:hypothetical protein
MAALLKERYDSTAEVAGWQEMRQQLFGQQRQRDAEIRLLRVLGEIHARLNGATRANRTNVLASPRVRAKALEAIVAGANQLICWHRDELLVNRTAGRWTSPLPETAQQILAEVQIISSLYDGAHVTGRTIECGDVIESIAALVGPESESFFNEALAGASAMLRFAFDRIAADPPTAPAAAGLGDTWDTLLADVDALAIAPRAMPVDTSPDPASEFAEPAESDVIGARILALFPEREPHELEADAPPIAVSTPPVIEIVPPVAQTTSPVILSAPKDLSPEPTPAPAGEGHSLRALFADLNSELPPTSEPEADRPVNPPLAAVLPVFEARFTRMELVAF